ncbi:MAG: sugar ABC transporter permease [Clostridia bacterium]|nr:sugar ABC transporter permease [Clostridia bacterium]
MKKVTKSASLRRVERERKLGLTLFLGPFLVTFFIFTVLPVFVSVLLSLTDFNLLEFPNFVGLENYSRLFLNDTLFPKAVQNTLILAMITGPGGYILCFAFAWLINEIPPKPRAFLTLLFFAPSLSGGLGVVWSLLFSNDKYGYINAWLLEFGIIKEPILWTVNTDYMWPVCIIILLWSSIGTSFLTFIAGLQTVDKSLYEAGAVDGIKNRWQELYFITLPQMRGQLLFGAVLSITGAFSVGAAIFPSPTQDYTLYTLSMHLADYGGARYEMGYASAIAMVMFIMTYVANQVIRFIIGKLGK